MQRKLFVQIASYRDSQLGPTLHDLISKAARPEQLRIGVCLQLDHGDESRCGPETLPGGAALRGAQLCVDRVASRQSGGVCWARARTQMLWEGEPFTLQIDSHMRFAANWDQELLSCWTRCHDRRAVLSVYPNAFTLPDICDTAMLPLMAAHRFDEDGILRLQGINSFCYPEESPPEPLPSAFVAAGLLFGAGEIITKVPYDPDLYFYGEEIALALRLWTHGFNAYNPDRLLIFHLYKRSGGSHITHWADHLDWSERQTRAIERVMALTRGNGLPVPFGLGSTRTLTQYQQWSGIDFAGQRISADAMAGRFRPAPATNTADAAVFPGDLPPGAQLRQNDTGRRSQA